MISREELLKTREYWFETLQNDIYRVVSEYIQEEGINQTALAEKLGVSRGYISQILNGNFNYTLKKLIELSLALNKAPSFEFKNLDSFIKEDNQRRYQMQYSLYFNMDILPKSVQGSPVNGGNNTIKVKQTGEIFDPIAA